MKAPLKLGKLLATLIHCIILITFCQVPVHAASADDMNNFYFDSFSADYYLNRAENGTSSLYVEETLVAVFPDTNQNHGITRIIPTTNQNGENFTMDPKTLTIDAYRNGEPEHIDRVEGDDSYHQIFIGSPDVYVHGRQEYSLRYTFANVITEHDGLQELYWDTNGTGFSQAFNSLDVRLHLDQSATTGSTNNTWCYVGIEGSSDQSRCKWQKNSDRTIEFVATGPLASGENLTFALTFAEGTFVVPEPPQDYTPIFATLIIAALSLILIVVMIVVYSRHRARYMTWKGTFVTPEYQPIKNLPVAEAALLSTTAKPQFSLSATLIELAISGKIKLEETTTKFLGKQKTIWSVRIVSTRKDLTKPQLHALEVINGGDSVRKGDLIMIERHTSNLKLLAAQKLYKEDTENSLHRKKLYRKSALISVVILVPIFYLVISLVIVAFASEPTYGSRIIGLNMLLFSPIGILLIAALALLLVTRIQKVAQRTDEGLKSERRLEGLRIFIKLAETERIKFLQTVQTAERINTKNGKSIVKLYEKLLPYAIIFGLEKSWSRELEQYYADNPNVVPVWYIGTRAFSASAFTSELHSVTSSISSSSGSGAGGGGFSGGGGGGGGGGGW